ncbi:MAG: GNAT family N-acetyltransferase [Ahrensia sp.]|nr:GNAT family N-acetyltransferase [Ahrensia sp.]
MDMPVETPVIRDAREDDIAALAAIFTEDDKGGHGDTADPAALPSYLAAFRHIAESPDNRLFVVEVGGEVVGTAQITFTTSLTGRGSSRMTIEAVQMRADMRGRGYGAVLMRRCIDFGRERGVRLVDLMSNAARTDAHRFYERLGFAKSHVGFKMKLG